MENIERTENEMMEAIQNLDRSDKVALLKKVHKAHDIMSKMEWPKDGYNANQKYAYRTEGMMKKNFQSALLDAGLIYKLDIVDVIDMPSVGSINTHMRATVILTLIDIDTSASMAYQVIGEAGDSGDKAAAKLMTMALKSAISTLFAISSDVDPDDGVDVRSAYTKPSDREAATEKLRRDQAAKTFTKPKAAVPKAPAIPSVVDDKKEAPAQATDGAITAMQRKTMERMLSKLTDAGDSDLEGIKEAYDSIVSSDSKAGASAWIKANRERVA